MAKIKAKYVLDLKDEKAFKQLGVDEGGRVQKLAMDKTISLLREFMPYHAGIMSARTYKGKKDEIWINVPYAHYQNEGFLYVNPKYGRSGFPETVQTYYGSTTTGFRGYKGKRVKTNTPLKYHGSPERGAHFVERALAKKDEIIREAMKGLEK